MNYKEQLKHPKWQKKRLEIMQRDNFQCQCCLSYENSLTVHHKEYTPECKAWEYHNKHLITLCDSCHTIIHALISDNFNFSKLFKCSKTDYYILLNRLMICIDQSGYDITHKLLIAHSIKPNEL